MVRQGMTGRTWQFKPDAATMTDLRNGAGIEIDNGGQGNFVRIREKSYALQELDPSTTPVPSCRINRILRTTPPNGNAPAGDQRSKGGTYYGMSLGVMVSTKGREAATGAIYHVTVRNLAALSALKVGHDVSIVTDAGPGEWAGRKWAVVRVEIGGKLEAYTFPVSLDANPEGPSSTVIFTDAARRTVTIRDNKTGRTMQFDAGTTPLEDLHPNTEIEISGGTVTPLMGNVDSIKKFYALNEPDPLQPCCAISQIFLALHGIVLRNKATGATHRATVGNQAVLSTLKVGQNVSMEATGKWAMFLYELDGKPATYSFPIEGASQKSSGPKSQVRYVARWDVQQSGVQDNLNGVVFPSSTTGYAVGANGTILKTTDEGKTWRRLVERKEAGPVFDEVLFSSPTEGWVKGETTLLHTSDGGETWDRPTAPGTSYGPCAVSGNTFYQMPIPRLGAHIDATSDGGKTWKVLEGKLPSNAFVTVCFVDDKHGWLAQAGGHTARTEDGGATWTTVDVPNGGSFSRIQFVTADTGWIMSSRDHGGGIHATSDGGKTWVARYAGIESYYPIADMRFLNDKNGFLLAADKNGYQCLRTDTGGTKWATIGHLIVDHHVHSLSFPDTTHGWVVGDKGYIVHYHLVPVTGPGK